MLLFMTLWSLVVYFPMAHRVWGKGPATSPKLDFAPRVGFAAGFRQ